MVSPSVSLYLRRLQIITEEGLTIYIYPETFAKNPQLISGMLSALFIFMREEYGGNVHSIMLSDRQIKFMRYGQYIIILELEQFVDEDCSNIFFSYLMNLLKPIFDETGRNYNLSIGMVSSLGLSRIFEASHQLEIMKEHDVPLLLSDAYVLVKLKESFAEHFGKFKGFSRVEYLRENLSEVFPEPPYGPDGEGYYSIIENEAEGISKLFIKVDELEVLIILPLGSESLFMRIGSGLKNLFGYLKTIRSELSANEILDLLLALRFPTEVQHDHTQIKKEEIPPDLSQAVLGFTLLGNLVPSFTEALLVGEKMAIAGDELSVQAVTHFARMLATHYPLQISPFYRESIKNTNYHVLLIHPTVLDTTDFETLPIFHIGGESTNIPSGKPFRHLFRSCLDLYPENRVILFEEGVRNVLDGYGDLLYLLVAEFDRVRAKEQLKELKNRLGSELFKYVQNILVAQHPSLSKFLDDMTRISK